MALVELVAQKGSVEAKIGDEKVAFRSSGAESSQGHSPTEYILAALGSCFAGTAFSYVKTKNFPLEKVILRIQGEKGRSPSHIQKIHLETELQGNLTYEEKERILQVAEKACTVMNTLRGGVEEITNTLMS